jgi:hypothetical protein
MLFLRSSNAEGLSVRLRGNQSRPLLICGVLVLASAL